MRGPILQREAQASAQRPPGCDSPSWAHAAGLPRPSPRGPIKGPLETQRSFPESDSNSTCRILVHPPWTERATRPRPEPSDTHPHVPTMKACASHPQFSHNPVPKPAPAASPHPGLRHSPSWLLGGASAEGGWGLGSSLLCSCNMGVGSEFSRVWAGLGAAGASAGLGTWISTLLGTASAVGAAGTSGTLEAGVSILRWAGSGGLTRVISVLRGLGSGVLWPSASARFSPKREGPGAPVFSTCLDEMSMDSSVRRDTGSPLGPDSSTLRKGGLGERWLRESAWRAVGSEFFAPRSWNFWVELATVARSSGVWTLRGGVELGVSTSSTSKDLFKAERHGEEDTMSGWCGDTLLPWQRHGREGTLHRSERKGGSPTLLGGGGVSEGPPTTRAGRDREHAGAWSSLASLSLHGLAVPPRPRSSPARAPSYGLGLAPGVPLTSFASWPSWVPPSFRPMQTPSANTPVGGHVPTANSHDH